MLNAGFKVELMQAWIRLSSRGFLHWRRRHGRINEHNGKVSRYPLPQPSGGAP